MTPEQELLRAKLRLLATEMTLEWLVESYRFTLARCGYDLKERSLKGIRDALQTARQDQVDLMDPDLPPEQARLQAAMFREAFDEAARAVERRLGLPPE